MVKKPAKKQLSAKWGSGGSFDRWIIVGIVVALAVIGLSLWGPLRNYRPGAEKNAAVQAKKTDPSVKKQPPTQPGKKEYPDAVRLAEKTVLVAIVIDDLGQDMKAAQEIISLPAKLTLAVMPGFPQSRKVADLAKQNKREVLLHLPMEYRGKNGKPAPGMLRSDMTPMELLEVISEDVDSVPGAVGVNNHEGSALTENGEAMKFLMAELKARDLFFLDSYTSSKSVAYATAKEFGMKAAKRDVFLDNESENAEYIRGQLDELTRIAREHGRAIGIGHPHPATISALRTWLADAAGNGITIVPVSKLMQ